MLCTTDCHDYVCTWGFVGRLGALNSDYKQVFFLKTGVCQNIALQTWLFCCQEICSWFLPSQFIQVHFFQVLSQQKEHVPWTVTKTFYLWFNKSITCAHWCDICSWLALHMKQQIVCNQVHCVLGHDPLTFFFLFSPCGPFSFLIEQEFYGPNYLKC